MSEPPKSWVARILIVAGSIGLMGAMLTDGLAVVGRHAGLPLAGSIEVTQAFVIVMAASAIAYASLGGDHAAVDLVYARLPEWLKRLLARVNALLGFALLGVLAFGSAWIAWEHWGSGEQTELVHVPLRWFRLWWIGAAMVAAGAFLLAAVKRNPKTD